MSSPKAAPRAAAPTAASLTAMLSPARAAASRTNGAKSKGPKTAEGKARSAQNALKHGLRAQKYVVLPEEDAAAFQAFEAALMEELAPQGALQGVLAQRVAAAAWRLERAERLEAEVFAREIHSPFGKGDLGLALIRDCNGARAFDTLLRYRGTTLAEFWRALRTLKALQADAAGRAAQAAKPAPRLLPEPSDLPIKPKSCRNPGDSGGPSDRADPQADPTPAPARLPRRPLPTAGEAASCVQPIEPERRERPAQAAPPSLPGEMVERGGSAASLLAGTALVPVGRRS